MMMANAARVDTALLVEILPSIEAAIIAPREAAQEEDDDDDT